jgi:hypothetical protein
LVMKTSSSWHWQEMGSFGLCCLQASENGNMQSN